MKKKELIQDVMNKLRDNGSLFFDSSIEVENEELISISSNGELVFSDDVEIELEDLSEDELEDLIYNIDSQIERDEKIFDKCRSYNY